MASIDSLAEARAIQSDGLEKMIALDGKFPGEAAFESIINQLRYIGPFLEEGVVPPRKDDLTFGYLAAKFLPEFDPSLSPPLASLYQYILSDYGAR